MNWQEFEVLVAALHHASSKGATVTWNDTIEGRQFDVTIRFKEGVHDYLTVIECKNYSAGKPVPVRDVEAFVTKSRGVKANKAVMVSATAYQNGGSIVAEREGIVLLTVAERYENIFKPPADAEKTDAISIYDISILFGKGKPVHLGDGAKMEYLATHSIITGPTFGQRTIHEIINEEAQIFYMDGKRKGHVLVPLTAAEQYIGKDGVRRLHPKGIEFELAVIEGAYISDTSIPFDFNLQQNLSRKYELRALDGSVMFESFLTDLSLGYWHEIKEGAYYTNPAFGFFYRCEKITGSKVTWFAVETYQYGHLCQARFIQDIKWSGQYVLVTDKVKLVELNKMYKRIQKDEKRK